MTDTARKRRQPKEWPYRSTGMHIVEEERRREQEYRRATGRRGVLPRAVRRELHKQVREEEHRETMRRIRQNKLFFRRLTALQREKIRAFNAFLVAICRRVQVEAQRVKRSVLRQQRRLTDYELDIRMSFILDQNDPAYRDDDDNIVAEHYTSITSWKMNVMLEDWGECLTMPGGPLAGEPFCYLLHELQEMNDMLWRDIIRIGDCWVDIMVEQQLLFRREKGKTVVVPWLRTGKDNDD